MTKDVKKIRRCDRKIYKAMIIPVDVNERNKRFTVTFQPKQ